MILKEKLITLREQSGLSQMVVAGKLGVSRQAVSRWESGASAPSMENLRALANLYHTSLDWLCDESCLDPCEHAAGEPHADTEETKNPTVPSLHPLPAQEPPAAKPVQKKIHILFAIAAAAVLLSCVLFVLLLNCHRRTAAEEIPIDELSEDKLVMPPETVFQIEW